MDTYLTLRPINFILKCFGLNCVCKKDNNTVSSWSLIKNVLIMFILCPINVIILYDIIQQMDLKLYGFTVNDAYMYVYIINFIKYIVDLVYVRKYGTEDCVSYYYAYDKIDEILKINNYSKIKITCLKILTYSCGCLTFSIIFDFYAWYSMNVPISFLFAYVYSIVTMLIIVDTASHVVQIEYRLRRLGDMVQDVNRNKEDISQCVTNVNESVHSEATRFYTLNVLNVNAEENGVWTPDDILPLSQCYLMLNDQTEFLNTMFGLPILLTCLSTTSDVINLMNTAIKMLFSPLLSGFPRLPILSSILYLVAVSFNMYTLAHRCEKVYRQNDRIIEIVDDLIIYRKAREEIILPLKELRELISSRPIRFHTSHFFRIDYTLLSAMTSVVVTYTIIVMQSLRF